MGLLSLKRSAEIAHVYEGTIRGAIRLGKLRAKRLPLSPKYMIEETDLMHWIDTEKPEPQIDVIFPW